ncbi:DUF500-domain-containing protein [Microthyrium microscopicum]|uniref:DUF500-domain-containing protein n=1 Tax=Microthyrium microscopicum TaxID=703497 RepID=A0A6A6UA46_9PEZI|nr:DUF500-domain-containing protein [Microthyrium microscopicum]
MWLRARSTSKAGFDRVWGWADKLGAPVNRLANKVGSEAFWPTTLDKEIDKAARILRSFCKDGFYEDQQTPTSPDGETEIDAPKKRYSKVLKKIPAEVIKNAKGLAVFTTMRTGLWVSGAGGSGVLVARLPDGTWSPPSGILLHTAGVGFLIGVDIYDCVVVLNTDEAVAAFSKIRCTLGGEISAVAGPVGVGGFLESEVHKRRAPIFTYLKSRGFYAGVQLDGSIIIERTDENERFYGRKIPVAEILAGRVTKPPEEVQRLIQTIKLAQGDTDVDPAMLSTEAAPSDFDIASGHVFGVPDKEDPDPYGVLALEKEGLEIREAGTRKPASRESFQFAPSPSSPLFHAFGGTGSRPRSIDFDSRRSSWKTSITERSTQMREISTQTDSEPPALPSRPQSGAFVANMAGIPEIGSIDNTIVAQARVVSPVPSLANEPVSPLQTSSNEAVSFQRDAATSPMSPTQPQNSILKEMSSSVQEDEARPVTTSLPNALVGNEGAKSIKNGKIQEASKRPISQSSNQEVPIHKTDEDADADDEDSSDDDGVEFSEIIEVSAPKIVTASPQIIRKARLVTVAKAIPPALPSRNPNRTRNARSQSPSRSTAPTLATINKAQSSEDIVDRPISRGSSVYSMTKEEAPSSTKASDSHGSISSAEHEDAYKLDIEGPFSPKLPPIFTGEHTDYTSNTNSTATLTPVAKTDSGHNI